MEDEKIYKKSDLNLNYLADELGTNTSYLSTIINTHFNVNLRSLINKYRIDEARKILVAAREASGGPFKSLDDLADRVDLRKLNRKTLECLTQAGALDDFGERPALLARVDAILGASAQIHSARDVGQFTLFGDMTGMTGGIQLPKFAPPIPDRKLLDWEKELLGTYLSKHPLTDIEGLKRTQAELR